MKCRTALALACITLAAREQIVLTQTTAPQLSQIPSLSAHSSLVLVPALVRTKHGDLIFTLTADDFVLTDDGIPQKLTLEQDTGGEPMALVVAIEIGGAGAREFDKLGSLAPMIESVVGNVPHKIAVVAFDSQPTLQQDFTPDIDAAAAAILGLAPDCSRQHHLDNCAAPGSIHDLGLEITEPPSSIVLDTPSTSSASNHLHIDARFCWSAKPLTAAATSNSKKRCAPSATPTPPSTVLDSQPGSLKQRTTPPENSQPSRVNLRAAGFRSRTTTLILLTDAWARTPTQTPTPPTTRSARHTTA